MNPPVPYNYDELQRVLNTAPRTAVQVEFEATIQRIHAARQQLMAESGGRLMASYFGRGLARMITQPRPKRFCESFRELLRKRCESFHLLPEGDRMELKQRAAVEMDCDPPECYEPGWVFCSRPSPFK